MTVHTGRVLVVDDDRATLTLCSRTLEQAGFSVQPIRQGSTALALVETEAFHLILLDLKLPELGGLAVLERLRQLGSDTPVLAISGQELDEALTRAIQLGIQGVLSRPLDTEQLLGQVAATLERSRERRITALGRVLRPLVALSTTLPLHNDPGALSTAMFELLRQELGADRAALLLNEEQGLRLAGTLDAIQPESDDLALADELLGQALRRRRVLLLGPEQIQPAQLALGSREDTIESALLAPLVCAEQLLGAIVVGRSSPNNPFSEGDRELLELLADQAATLIGRQRSHQQALGEVLAQQQASQQRAQIEKLEAVGRLAAAIAHEINNPLQAIHNSLHLMLSRQLSPEKEQRYLELAQREVEGLITIVRRTLDVHQSSEDGLRLVNLHDVLQYVLTTASAGFEAGKIRVRREWAADLPPVQATVSHLKQALLNLVLNAVEAMPKGGTLTVRTATSTPASSVAPPWVLVEISDTGDGIAPDKLSYIFEPFYSTKGKNPGLGLTISYNIIARHGGELSVSSTPGESTVFSIRLPAAGND